VTHEEKINGRAEIITVYADKISLEIRRSDNMLFITQTLYGVNAVSVFCGTLLVHILCRRLHFFCESFY
jgi:uncharacterized protein (DUF342 family)